MGAQASRRAPPAAATVSSAHLQPHERLVGGRLGGGRGGLTRCPGRELQRFKGRQAAAGQARVLGVGQEELAEPGLGLLGLGGAESGR